MGRFLPNVPAARRPFIPSPNRATVNVSSTGPHSVNIWMREDGSTIDKIVLTTSSGYTPSGAGPAESPRGF